MDKSIITHVHDFNLYQQVKDIIKQVKPMSSALQDILQSGSAILTDVSMYGMHYIAK